MKQITIRHLFINNAKQIGIQFYPDKVIQALVKDLPQPKWSSVHKMAYILNTKENLSVLFEKFRGIAWVNCNYFFENTTLKNEVAPKNVTYFRKRQPTEHRKLCPETFLDKLEIKRYSENTVKAYVNAFEDFINYYKDQDLDTINDEDIRKYIQYLIQQNRSDSYVNLAINSIKFYYEVVLNMPNRFYSIERPRKKDKLPKVISKDEVFRMIEHTTNLKHKCIISLLYSGGLRRSELLNLKPTDIESDRMLIRIEEAKGNKDRYTILSEKLLVNLRTYYKTFRPKNYLFESYKGTKYSTARVLKIVKTAAVRAGIIKNVTPHMLRHSFATHLLENCTDIRYIQELLGHNSTKTTEIYTHAAKTNFNSIKNPLDL